MSINLYQISIPIFIRGLTNLAGLLDKAEAYATAKKFDPNVLLQSRLFPDMFALARQVQIACDMAKGAAARLGGVDNPKHEDTETTLPELKARIQMTIDFVKNVDPGQFQGVEAREVVLKFPTHTLTFNGLTYLTDFALPNLYFHLAMTYALLRSNGVELGKRDFLGAIQA